jgi:hypothetical protein
MKSVEWHIYFLVKMEIIKNNLFLMVFYYVFLCTNISSRDTNVRDCTECQNWGKNVLLCIFQIALEFK